jgi:hypothetical protein
LRSRCGQVGNRQQAADSGVLVGRVGKGGLACKGYVLVRGACRTFTDLEAQISQKTKRAKKGDGPRRMRGAIHKTSAGIAVLSL